jgi:hypothetical protein
MPLGGPLKKLKIEKLKPSFASGTEKTKSEFE